MDDLRQILMQLNQTKIQKLIKELEALNDKDLKDLIEYLKSIV